MSIDLQVLKDELASDTFNLGYAAAADDQARADLLNAVPGTAQAGRTKDREEVASWEIFESVVKADFTALSAEDKNLFYGLLSMGSVNIQRPNTRSVLMGMFGPGTPTRTRLAALQAMPISRAAFLGLPQVTQGDIERMRARLP